ncbi:MAG: hypothetical protein MPK03_00895 [Alphaproteobacteria bacterium]|nr:hypothetical protein [Alphaproteobacteria bacterium]
MTVSESDGAAVLTVSLSPAATVDINGVFSTANDTAVAGADYTAVTDKKFTIAAGESEAKVEVAVINDNALELDESFDVVAAVNGSSLTATVVVTDDDPASARLAVRDANDNTISELSEAAAADAPLTVSVSLSDNLPPGSAPVDVVISATAPAGVSPIASQTLTFAATEGTDEVSATLTLPSDISNSLNDDTRAVVITATPIVPPSLSNKILTTAPSQSIKILDDDPVISFTVSPLTLAEGDTFTVTVATVKPVNSALSVPMTFGGGEPSPVADIDIVGGLSDRVIVVPKGAKEGALTVAVADDNFVENAESLILDFASLSSSRAAKKAGALPQSVTINDNDTAGISVSDVSVSEDDGTATITVSLDTAAAVDVAGTFTTTDGTATVLDNDYTAAENVPFTIPAGQTSAAIAVALNDDELFEPAETFTVTITSTTPQVSVSTATATVTVNEDDPAPVLTVNRETLNVSEDGAAQIEFVLDRPSSRPVNINYNVAAALTNTAQSSDIAAGFTSGAVVVPANDTRGVISVSLIDDEIVEPDEHFVVSLVSGSLYTLGSAATVAVTLSDNDNDTLIVSAPSSVVGKSFDISGELNIAVQVPAGAAVTFTDSAAPDLVFTDSDGDGLISESELAAVVRYSHAAAEKLNLNYTFTPAHRLKSSQFINGQTQIMIAAPSMSVPASVTVNENAGAVSVAVSLDTVAAVDIPGTFSTTDGAATAGSDYTAAVNTPFVIKAGQTAATLSVSVTDDSALEENEHFAVTVKSDSSLVSVVNDTATVNIRDDDSLSTLLTLKDGAAAVSEIGEADAPGKEITAEIALSETLPAGDPLVVAVSVALPAGVSPVADQRVAFSAGEGKSPKSVAFTLPDDIDNTRNDGTRAVVITATPTGIPAARGATVAGTPATARISILDDDPEITFTVSDNEVAEGESFIVTVISSKPVNRALAVPLALRAGRALVSQDIVGGLFGKSAVIPKGMTEGTTTIAVANDNEVEDHETVTVDFASLIGTGIARKWLTNPQTVTIIDGDTAALVVSDITVPENVLGGKAALTVSLLGAVAGRDITGAFSTADGTATAPDDYTAAVNAPFTIVAGQKSVAVAVDIIDEGILEPSENFTVSIASTTPRVTTPAETATATVTVTEADSALLSIADASAAENAGAVSVALSLAAPAGIDITGVFSTSDRTATAPDDYTAAVNAPFTIKAGQTSAAVTVAVIDDNLHETAETFNIKIKPAHPGVVTAEDTATVTVTDNDTPPVISFLFGTASGDENENAELALLMNKPVAADVAVSVAASASAPANARFPADEGADYTIHHEFIIRPADGITPTLAVPVIDDNIVEAPETFTVTLRPARGYTLGARTALAYTVRDNDITALGDFTTSPARPAVGDTFTISASLSNPLQYYQGPDGQPVYFFEPNTAGLAFADTDYDGYIHGDELTTTSIMPVRAGGTLVYKNKLYVAPKTPGKFSVAFSATTGHSVRNTGYSDSQFKNATFSRNITDKTALSIPSGRQRISVGEGAGAAEVVIQINPALGQNAAASLVIKNDSDAGTVDASPREDYSRFSFNVKLSADAASVVTEIPIISDDIVEADETMQVRLVASPGAPYIVAPNSVGDARHANAIITITDDDTAELALAVAPANPITDREFTLTATLGKSVQVARKGSLVFTNTAGAPPLVFVDLNANGRISGAERTVSVRHTHKTAEALSLDYSLTPKYGLASDKFTGGALSVDILAPAVVQFVAGDAVKSVPESDSRGVISLTVESDRALGVNTLVPAAVSNAATSRRIGDTVADIAPTGTRHPFSIAVVGDTIVEPDKVYNITLFPLDDAPYVLGARKVARVTIADDDTAALSLVTLPESPVAGRDFTVAATLSRSVRVPFGGSLTFTDDGGAPDLVFIDRNSDALISGGELSVSVNHTHDDAGVVGLDYDFVPQHGLRADKFSGGTFDIAVVPKPVLQFVAADETKSIVEGDNPGGSLRLFIEADKDVGVATEIVAVISGAGGRIGSDRVTVTPVGTRFRFSFLFRGNDSVEPDKTFTVALVAVDDAPYSIGGRGVATVNVADDDTVTVGNFVVNPAAPVAGSPFTVSATLTAPVQYSGSAPLIFYEGGGKQRAFKFRDGDGDGFIRGDEMTTFVEDAAGATHSYSVNGAGTYLLRFSRPVIADGAYDAASGLKDSQFTDPEILTIRISNPGTQ